MAYPETSPQSLNSLVSADVEQLKHHGLLRQLVSAQVTEELLDAEELEPEAMKRAMQGYRKRNNLATAEQLQQHCRRFGYSQEDLQWQAGLQERIRRTGARRFEAKAELHYLTRKEQFDQVTYSQLSAPNQFLAQELFLRINEGEATFGELAAQLRKGGNEKGQGRFGPTPLAKVPAALAKPLRSCSTGTLLEPIQVQSSWLIVRLEQFQPTQFDAAMQQRMCTELFQQEVARIVDERIAALTNSNGSEPT
ncbi:MAG: peptidylprolyl isomerase [Cyanobacteriota bacterium]|nr:peptidylprolyl isomerase [Cyanobacteriota bacterium]